MLWSDDMKVFYVVAAIFLVVVIYFFSALVPLPWYIYPPFIALFVLSFYWDKLAKYLPWDISRVPSIFKRKQRPSSTTKKSGADCGKRI